VSRLYNTNHIEEIEGHIEIGNSWRFDKVKKKIEKTELKFTYIVKKKLKGRQGWEHENGEISSKVNPEIGRRVSIESEHSLPFCVPIFFFSFFFQFLI